jgi:F420-non-reducing hydrogenase iron-sulfur subunit
MPEPVVPDVLVNVCHNCIADAEKLPRQWKQSNGLVCVRDLPCSGKIDLQYLVHLFDGACAGVCVVACEPGTCRLAQGNQRAEIRVRTLRRLLSEIGLHGGRAELLHCSAHVGVSQLEQVVRAAVERICALGPSPLRADASGRFSAGAS